ncbi:ferredoxin-type protein NapF [Vibrio sp. 10N.286.49.B3]|uniref:ferredoxin-type protein NapF n=1 Tax=Vibrio sp. 10N.286.49.B3 TaxID=1880855 RepID=UPI000C83167D|nr:ferredoxin-type protein NapF [Vibrio sp. 10N.286.49.B3]PMH43861.1 ferredoxin-type protein NapF [Vibrio sp. 10N.286.49.B3]
MSEIVDPQRRGFLTRFSKPVSAIRQAPEVTPREQPRPPCAVDEALFTRLCDGCGLCQSACPNGVIEIQDGLAKINLDYNECSLCKQCVVACNADALHDSINIAIDLQPTFSQACNNYLQIECNQCQQLCPQAAILVEEDELPSLDKAKCTGCGQCCSHCYIGVITMQFVP